MEKQLFEGETKEEAKRNALEELGLEESDVVFINNEIEESKTEKCEIEVVTKNDLAIFIKDILKKITNLMGINCNIEYKNREGFMYFNIVANESGLLIGKNGKMLDALQTFINQVIATNTQTFVKIQIDVADYRQKRNLRLEKLAKYTAKDVALSKCEVKLDPMNSYERRIIHNTLTNSRDVFTESVGVEPNRCVVIKPKDKKLMKK